MCHVSHLMTRPNLGATPKKERKKSRPRDRQSIASTSHHLPHVTASHTRSEPVPAPHAITRTPQAPGLRKRPCHMCGCGTHSAPDSLVGPGLMTGRRVMAKPGSAAKTTVGGISLLNPVVAWEVPCEIDVVGPLVMGGKRGVSAHPGTLRHFGIGGLPRSCKDERILAVRSWELGDRDESGSWGWWWAVIGGRVVMMSSCRAGPVVDVAAFQRQG